MKQKLIVILGPTATGKSELAVKIAKKFNGEIVSADSRQVYKGLDLGSGKITKKEMGGISHHMLDVANPKNVFNVEKYGNLARKKIIEIIKRNKTPLLVGGTGFYIQSVVDNTLFPNVPPDNKLRKNLERKNVHDLFSILQRIDLRRSENIDANNKIRLIRAIEIAKKLGKVPPISKSPSFEVLKIGIDLPDKTLKAKIAKRLQNRIKHGMIEEVKKLHHNGLSWSRMNELGLEYRFISKYLMGTISKKEMGECIVLQSWKYVKRQRTWFKKDTSIKWFSPSSVNMIERRVRAFLDNS